MKVAVYKNLHKGCYSVKALSGPEKGRVVKHVDSIVLESVEFRVQKQGRERVLRDQKKNVHAFVVGVEKDKLSNKYRIQVAYNPYKYSTFVYRDINTDDEYLHSIYKADEAELNERGIFVS